MTTQLDRAAIRFLLHHLLKSRVTARIPKTDQMQSHHAKRILENGIDSLAGHRGAIETVGDAVKDHRVLTITCQRCSRWKTIWAYRFSNSFEKAKALSLNNTVPGFYCTGCRRKVSVVIEADGP